MRFIVVLFCVSVIALSMAPGVQAAMVRLEKTWDIELSDARFKPNKLNIRSGDRLRFCNKDIIYHKIFYFSMTRNEADIADFIRVGTFRPGQCITTDEIVLPGKIPSGYKAARLRMFSELNPQMMLQLAIYPDVRAPIPPQPEAVYKERCLDKRFVDSWTGTYQNTRDKQTKSDNFKIHCFQGKYEAKWPTEWSAIGLLKGGTLVIEGPGQNKYYKYRMRMEGLYNLKVSYDVFTKKENGKKLYSGEGSYQNY